MEKSVLFFDIDGTLISNHTDRIPQSTVDALYQAKKNGHMIFVNTGRTICAVRPEVRKIDFDGLLCGCGTYIIYHDQVLLRSSIEEKRGQDIIEKMYACGLEGVMEGTEDNFLPREMSRFSGLENQRKYFDKYLGIAKNRYIGEGSFVYDKLFVYADEKSDKQTFFDYISEDMEIVDRGGDTYEIIQKGYSKWTACDFIMRKLGIDRENSYAFGDSTNDLSMFEYARHTIAMGEHAKELEPYTEYITRRVEEDGVAYAMKHYGII